MKAIIRDIKHLNSNSIELIPETEAETVLLRERFCPIQGQLSKLDYAYAKNDKSLTILILRNLPNEN